MTQNYSEAASLSVLPLLYGYHSPSVPYNFICLLLFDPILFEGRFSGNSLKFSKAVFFILFVHFLYTFLDIS